jgi:single-strand DNA-binding protein
MINNVVLVGRIVKELDLKYIQSGKAVARFNLAVNRDFKDANGDSQADFPSCQVWGETAEIMADNLRKGSLIDVTGRIQTGSYEKDGQRIYTTDAVVEKFHFLEAKNDSSNRSSGQQDNGNNQQNSGGYHQSADPFSNAGEPYISDDDVPF